MFKCQRHGAARRLTRIVCLLAMAIPCRAPADDLQPPPAGRRLDYVCSGNFGHEREYVVRSVVGGVVTYNVTVDGGPGYAVKPLWLTGTSLYRELATKRGGKSLITSGLENFNGLRALTVGTQYAGWIVEKGAGGAVTRSSVTVTVAAERDYQSDALGKIRVSVLEETWTSGGRTQTGVSYVSKPRAAVAYWRHSTAAGKGDECRLVALHDP